jgi:hypothetical protein
MSEKTCGWLLTSRCMRSHPVVGSGRPGKAANPALGFCYSHREAWEWLLEEASYKPRLKVVHGQCYSLEVGDLVASIEFMAMAWNWTPKAVRWFLEKLGASEMVNRGTQKGRRMPVVSICNYSKYQMLQVQEGQASGQANAEITAPTRKKDKQGKRKSEVVTPDAPALPFIAEADAVNIPKVGHETLTKTGNVAMVSASEVQIAFDKYNKLAVECGLPVARVLDESRAKKIKARLKAGGMEAWDNVLAEIAKSKFLRGMTPPSKGRTSPFQASLKIILQPDWFNDIGDGNYSQRKGDVAPPLRPAVNPLSQADIEVLAEKERREYQEHIQAQRAKRAAEKASQDNIDF